MAVAEKFVAEKTVKPRVKQKRMTEAEFMGLPKDGRKWELVEGRAQEVPSGHKHDAIGMNVGAMLKPFARGRGVIAGSQAGFRMASGNLRCPDVSFTRRERMVDEEPSDGFESVGPDLAVEIISPSEEPAEIFRKLAEYFASGAEQVWLMNPPTRRVTVYTSPLDAQTLSEGDELTAGELLPGFSCRVADLFDYE